MAKYQYSRQSFWRSKTRVMFNPEVWGQCRFCLRVEFNRSWYDKLRKEHPERFTDTKKDNVIEPSGNCTECSRFV